ncbi:MAG: cytochrome c biogenesis protein CcdA [Clostridiales bacterium]|nr:cytochrome c biogenesis protein CcdA [Clostridiales bacterium]
MRFAVTFLEGLITFISPCVLPLLPVYVMYFAGGDGENEKKSGLKVLFNALGFVLGFTVVFVLLGLFASSLNVFLLKHKTAVNIVTGAVVVFFGLHYTGLLKLGFLNKTMKPDSKIKPNDPLSAALFGIVFAIGWSPCTGAFLGSAMMLASQQSSMLYGMLLLAAYSAGLGVPFVLCAMLIDSLKSAFAFIKKNYKTVNIICGVFLIVTGILMMTGVFSSITTRLAA